MGAVRFGQFFSGPWPSVAMNPISQSWLHSAQRSSSLLWGLMAGLPGFASHERSIHLQLAANSGSSWMFQAPNLQLVMQLLNAGKCNLMALTTKNISLIFSSFRISACTRIPYSLCWRHSCLYSEYILVALWGVAPLCPGSFSPPIPSPSPLSIQYDRCLFPFPVLGLIAGLPGFSSYGRTLHL